ncbi:glycosyltransferase family 4 protein [Larkinella punicea]|uniref:Glycosyltransferase family 1 protein n=1 Tax=Larkinella punicea TaxID=2315727 RepID=A0A368JWQ3_9BACT|nr:glycosyltransferase family 1 protein [Larkinella punicea]RCR71063.1 glycosyltransferase family 1 protein [Larkinella punicea]
MKIFFDHQTFSQQNYGGISRYFCELIAGINQPPAKHQAHLSLLFSNNAYLKEKSLPAYPFLPGQPFSKTQPYLYRINKAFNLLEMKTRSYDVFHATYYEPYFLDHIRKRPVVVTFLDMIHEKYHTVFPELAADYRVMQWKKQIIDRATAVIAISENTKRDLIAYYNIPPERVRVIYLGSSVSLEENTAEQSTTPPYLLFVGNRGMYKNFFSFIRAAAPLLLSHQIRVICAGGGPFSPEEEVVIRQLNIHDLVEQQPIDDASLRRLYSQALGFVFPSLYEGFGIPVLEAFACGCPCLLSNRSSLPEVAGSAALYFDPENRDSIHDAIGLFLNNPALRLDLARLGRLQLQQFSWDRTVRETLDLYQSLQ